MSTLQSVQREEFRVHGRVTYDSCHVRTTEDLTDTSISRTVIYVRFELAGIDVSYGSDVDIMTRTAIELMLLTSRTSGYGALDSHFDLDIQCNCNHIWKNSSERSVEDVLKQTGSGIGRPQLDVDVPGCIIVYSEPSSHPSTISLCSWGVAIGMHPKHCEELTSKHFAHMRDLLSSP